MKLQCTAHGLPAEPDDPSEDAFRFQLREESIVAALADGLGSSKEGGSAARRAVDMMIDYYSMRPQTWSPRRALAEFADQINRLFYQESQLRHGAPELLCTLSVVAVEGDYLYGLNVGDSPIYLWRRGALTLLSQNHAMEEIGFQHVLMRAVGLTLKLEPYVFEVPVENGDIVLICSDGVSATVPFNQLATLLERRASARSVVSAARELSAEKIELRDDASAMVLDIVERGWRSETSRRRLEVLPRLRPGDTIDHYQLVRSLQEGDRVWLAKNAHGVQQVLKFPSLEAANDEPQRDAFVREMWQATRLDSPDFVRAFTPEEGSLRYYVMDYVEAPTLREVLSASTLPVEETVLLARFLLRAEQFLLTRDHAHGDIKPDNILVLRKNERLDFQLLDLGSTAEVFSVTSRAGTPTYLAPERFSGGALSERTEIFSIGVTLYKALTRRFPYGEIERFQTPRFESSPRPPSQTNPAVPPWLDATLLRAVSADADTRYQAISEMSFDLDHPESVVAFHRKDAPLLERDPLLFYKLLSLLLLLGNIVWFVLWARR